MKRKVIQLARNTHVVTLPSSWMERFKIEKGDELNLEEINTDIIISTDKACTEEQVEVDISLLDKRTIMWICSAMHKHGYNQIRLLYNDPKQIEFVRDRVQNLLTGFIIADTTDKSMVLQSVSKDIESEFHPTLRRAFRVALAMADETHQMLRNNDFSKKQNVLELEVTNNQLTNFCQRLLNKRGFKEYNKTTFYYVIAWNLEKICDNYKYIIEDLSSSEQSEPIPPGTLNFLKQCNDYFTGYYELLYDYNAEKLLVLSRKRDSLKELKNIIHPSSYLEIKLVSHMFTLFTQITDFSAAIIAVNTNTKNS